MTLHFFCKREPPQNWETKALKRAFRLTTSGNGIIKNTAHTKPQKNLFPAFSATGQDIWLDVAEYEGDGIILSAVGARSGKCFQAFGRWSAIANTHILFPSSVHDVSYLWYMLNNETFWFRGGTAQPYVQLSDTLNLKWHFPAYWEQKAIASFLDRKTVVIDDLIAKKERLIALLEEKRAALINRAVTKGLNPDVPMKDSGIPWIGEIPAGWEAVRLKYLLARRGDAIRVGPFGSSLTSSDMEGLNTKVFNQRTVIDKDFKAGNAFVSLEKANELKSFFVEPGDLLLTTRGTIGRAAIVPDWVKKGILHPCLLAMRFNDKVTNADWIRLLIEDSDLTKNQLTYLSNATTIDVIYSYNLREIYLPLPPKKEQRELLKYTMSVDQDYSRIITSLQDQISQIFEYRQSLITAAVTGQIDVPFKESKDFNIMETSETLLLEEANAK